MSLLSSLVQEDLETLITYVDYNVLPYDKKVILGEFENYLHQYQEKHRQERNKDYCVHAQIMWQIHMNQYCFKKGYNVPFEAREMRMKP